MRGNKTDSQDSTFWILLWELLCFTTAEDTADGLRCPYCTSACGNHGLAELNVTEQCLVLCLFVLEGVTVKYNCTSTPLTWRRTVIFLYLAGHLCPKKNPLSDINLGMVCRLCFRKSMNKPFSVRLTCIYSLCVRMHVSTFKAEGCLCHFSHLQTHCFLALPAKTVPASAYERCSVIRQPFFMYTCT